MEFPILYTRDLNSEELSTLLRVTQPVSVTLTQECRSSDGQSHVLYEGSDVGNGRIVGVISLRNS